MSSNPSDIVARRILAIALTAEQASTKANPPIQLLADLGKEIQETQGNVLINNDLLDRILVARLIENPPKTYPQTPVQYLLGIYSRSSDELRSSSIKPEAQQIAVSCKELAVAYAGLCLISGLVSQPPDAEARGALQLYDSLSARYGSSQEGIVPLPPGFLEEFCTRFEEEGLEMIIGPLLQELAARAVSVSPVGDYTSPLSAIRYLVSIEPLARVAVKLPNWLPAAEGSTGRDIMVPAKCWLGPFLSISAIPDKHSPALPDVYTTCYAQGTSRRPGDLRQAFESLRLASKQIYDDLHSLVKALLGKGTRAQTIQWLGAVIERNTERGKLHVDLAKVASHGFFINLAAIMLRLSAPFSSPSSSAFWSRVDVRYVAGGGVVTWGPDETRVVMTTQELQKWQSTCPPPPSEYHFICECFFMTIKVLHLSVVKGMRDLVDMVQEMPRIQRFTDAMEAHGIPPAYTELGEQYRAQRAELDYMTFTRPGYEAVLHDPALLTEVLAFYRLVAVWLLRLAFPSGEPTSLPLPPPPPEFTSLPDHFVEDLVEVMYHITYVLPQALQSAALDDLIPLLVVLMGSSAHVKTTALRSRMSQVLFGMIPQQEEMSLRGRRGGRGDVSEQLSYIITGAPMVKMSFVPALLRLFVDIENSERHNAFYEKFSMRHSIINLLHFAWTHDVHKEVWHEFASSPATAAEYLRFTNMLINDAIYLLDESLKQVKEMRRLEAILEDPSSRTPLEIQESTQALQRTGDQLKGWLVLAQSTIRTMHYVASEVPAPFLQPEMVERVASMLNYFLMYLTGPQRKELKVKDPDKYNFKPRDVLVLILRIYLVLARLDSAGSFVSAVAADRRSYRSTMFSEARAVMLGIPGMMDPVEISELEMLAMRAQEAFNRQDVEDEAMGDVPEEFMDPIMCTIMTQPVTLPTSGTVLDKATIDRHLLSDQRDPINRAPLTADMLIPNVELKARIDEWLAKHKVQGSPMET